MEWAVAKRVWTILEPLVTHEGMEIIDIDYRREGRGTILRLFLDREGGVSLDDLAPMSRRLGDLLDAHEALPGPYTLEVSSPGINRRLRLPGHFRAYVGKKVRVRTLAPILGHRTFLGPLQSAESDGIVVGTGSAAQFIPYEEIAQANYEHEFAPPAKGSCKPGKRTPSR